MKVIYVFSSFGGGGTESHLYTLIKNSKLYNLDASIFIISNEDNFYRKFKEKLNIPVYYLPITDKYRIPGHHLIKSFFYLLRILRQNNYDIAHTYFFWGQILGTIAAKLSGIKCIISNREDTGFGIASYQYPLLRLANRYTDKIIPIADYISEIRSTNESIPASKLEVIHNGIEINNTTEGLDKEAIFGSMGVSTTDYIITTTANLNHPVKGHKYLIEAASILKKRGIDVKFVLLGDGKLRQELQQLAKDNSVEDNIKFLGFRNDVHNILSVSDLFLLPSLSEGLSIALLEAMTIPLPIIATSVGGTPEVIINNESGILIEPEDPTQIANAIESLYKDKNQSKFLARNAYSRVHKFFAIENTASKYNKLYEETLSKKR